MIENLTTVSDPPSEKSWSVMIQLPKDLSYVLQGLLRYINYHLRDQAIFAYFDD